MFIINKHRNEEQMKKLTTLFTLTLLIFSLIACQPSQEIETYDFKALNPLNDIYYQVFIRSFADSDGDGIGDINGLTDNLDYIKDLGATAIWMLPFTQTEIDWLSYHGYRVTDYYEVHPEYGTMADLENLIDKADEMGIKIVMDLVINHTSDTHPWYQSAVSSTSSPFRDYYLWTTPSSAFESFPGGMKDLNLGNPEVVNEIKDIVSFWMDKGIKGFRFDAAKHLFLGDPGTNPAVQLTKNYAFLRDLQLFAKAIDPEVFFLGEVFEYSYDVYKNYYIGLDSVFDFYTASEIWSKVGNRSNMSLLVQNINRAFNSYKTYNPNYVPSLFISNHDIDRVASRAEYSDVNGINDLKQSVSFMMTLPGSPHIYYGDELLMKGTNFEGTSNHGKDLTGQGVIYDQYRRAPFKWGDASKETTWLNPFGDSNQNDSLIEAKNDVNSMYHHYKTMSNLRQNTPALMYGNTLIPYENNSTFIQGYYRTYTYENFTQTVLVLHNMSDVERTVDIEYDKILYGSSLSIPAFGTIILEV